MKMFLTQGFNSMCAFERSKKGMKFSMIVDTSKKYNSTLLQSDINSLTTQYPFISLITIGYSVLGKPIYCIKLRIWYERSFLFWIDTCK